MAPASGVPANLPVRNSRTDTGEDQVVKSVSTGLFTQCLGYCLYKKVLGICQTNENRVVENNADMTAFLGVAINIGLTNADTL